MEQSHPDYLRLPLAARLAGDYGAGGATAVVHLAEALATAIPSLVKTHRSRKFLGMGGHLLSLEVHLQAATFILRLPTSQHDAVRAEKRRVVKGIVLATETLEVAEWLEELGQGLEELARHNRSAAEALEKWLG